VTAAASRGRSLLGALVAIAAVVAPAASGSAQQTAPSEVGTSFPAGFRVPRDASLHRPGSVPVRQRRLKRVTGGG
jgi:hypothetical protein